MGTNDDDDDASARASFRLTKEIPLWGVLGVLALLGVQAISLYFGQARTVEKLSEVAAEVRALSESANKNEIERAEIRLRLADMERRVNVIQQK